MESNFGSWEHGHVDGCRVPYVGFVDGHEYERLTNFDDMVVEPISDEADTCQLHIPRPFAMWTGNGLGGCAVLPIIVIGFGVEEHYIADWAEIVEYDELSDWIELSQLSDISGAPTESPFVLPTGGLSVLKAGDLDAKSELKFCVP